VASGQSVIVGGLGLELGRDRGDGTPWAYWVRA
jgi:hypothetical protein